MKLLPLQPFSATRKTTPNGSYNKVGNRNTDKPEPNSIKGSVNRPFYKPP